MSTILCPVLRALFTLKPHHKPLLTWKIIPIRTASRTLPVLLQYLWTICTVLKFHLESWVYHLLFYSSHDVFASLVKSFKGPESRRSDPECLSEHILMQELFLIPWLFWLGLVVNWAEWKRSDYTIKKQYYHNSTCSPHRAPIPIE